LNITVLQGFGLVHMPLAQWSNPSLSVQPEPLLQGVPSGIPSQRVPVVGSVLVVVLEVAVVVGVVAEAVVVVWAAVVVVMVEVVDDPPVGPVSPVGPISP
jgi:hypothetical protein